MALSIHFIFKRKQFQFWDSFVELSPFTNAQEREGNSKVAECSEPVKFQAVFVHFFKISHCLSIVELRPSSSLSTGCVVLLRGDWAIFCHAGSGRVGRVRSAREKSLEILRRGWELNPGHGEDRQWAIPLSYHDWLFGIRTPIFWLRQRVFII